MFDYQYAYLIFNVFFFLIWLALFLIRPDLRKKMLVMSLIVAPLGFTQYFYFQDYWHPTYSLGTLFGIAGIEDILWSFFIGGITAVIYEEIFGIHYAKRHVKNHFFWMLGFSFFGVLGMFIGTMLLGFNSLYVSVAVLLIAGIILAFFRHDLLKDAIWSGLLVGGLMFIFYVIFCNTFFQGIIQSWWSLENISGVIIMGAPLEELMWAFSWGFIAGPTYEFMTGLKFKKK